MHQDGEIAQPSGSSRLDSRPPRWMLAAGALLVVLIAAFVMVPKAGTLTAWEVVGVLIALVAVALVAAAGVGFVLERMRQPSGAQAGVLIATFVPVAVFVLLLLILLWKVNLTTVATWSEVGMLVVLVLVSLVAAAGLRFIMDRLTRTGGAPSAPVDPADMARNRIAPFVLALGGAAIILLTLALVVTFALLASFADDNPDLAGLAQKIDTVLLGIFGAVLPIVATWVGTVIAFYFTNESYRQAAAATREAVAGAAGEAQNASSIMVAYPKIGKLEVPNEAAARAKTIGEAKAKMQVPVTRLVFFEEGSKKPIFIIRMRDLEESELDDTSTINEFLAANPEFLQSAKLFRFVAATATANEARSVIVREKCPDLFVTATGQDSEPVQGWIADDMLLGR
jgi:uncharacterized membrane protein (DUF485 family)